MQKLIFECSAQRTQHAVVPEDPAVALGSVHTDLQPVFAPLRLPAPSPLRRPHGSRTPGRWRGARLFPGGRLGVPPAVGGVPLLLHVLLLLLFLRRFQPGETDCSSRRLPHHETDEAQGAGAPQQQQQRAPEEQADPVPGRPHQHHERPVRRGQVKKPARKGG